jgi:hypothetical protein
MSVLEEARDIDWDLAYEVLCQTATWRESATHWRMSTEGRSLGSLFDPDGAVYVVGDVLGLSAEHESPHRSGRCTWSWRVVEVVDSDDPAFTGQLILEPFKDAES